MQIVQSKDQVVILAMDWIQKYKVVIDMNEERITFTEDDTIETIDGDDESCPIMIESEEESTSSDEDTILIPSQLKGKFLDDAIASYKVKCQQYIEQRKAERLANYLKWQVK